jgi:hypothetical protein
VTGAPNGEPGVEAPGGGAGVRGCAACRLTVSRRRDTSSSRLDTRFNSDDIDSMRVESALICRFVSAAWSRLRRSI